MLLICFDCPATLEMEETPEAQRAAAEAGWALHRSRGVEFQLCPKHARQRLRQRLGRTELGRLARAQMDAEEA